MTVKKTIKKTDKKKTFNLPLIEGMDSVPEKDHYLRKFIQHNGPIQHNSPKRIKRAFLGFKYDSGYYIATIIFGHFRPHGLMLWDIPSRTWMTQALLGNQNQILAGWNPIPADLFTMGQNFEQITKLIEDGIEPPGWPDFDSAQVGDKIRIRLTDDNEREIGSNARVAMWGLVAEY